MFYIIGLDTGVPCQIMCFLKDIHSLNLPPTHTLWVGKEWSQTHLHWQTIMQHQQCKYIDLRPWNSTSMSHPWNALAVVHGMAVLAFLYSLVFPPGRREVRIRAQLGQQNLVGTRVFWLPTAITSPVYPLQSHVWVGSSCCLSTKSSVAPFLYHFSSTASFIFLILIFLITFIVIS